MPKKLRPAVDLMAFKCRTLKVKTLKNAPTDGHKDMTTLTVAFHNFAQAHKIQHSAHRGYYVFCIYLKTTRTYFLKTTLIELFS
jgi:hypothetical protein